jgi:DNA mismatch repair protein MutL
MERRSIHQLSPSLVNRIAAGEVIERPASIVKELVENAIDAGATHIIVEVEDGGRELIRVIDDGSGIPAQELPLAFASHATSKLQTDDDLFAINTMGFRGEALASIGAVSHARICSRPSTGGDGFAHEIFNRGGAITEPQAAAGNVGTTIEIRNVFFNTPARRKFMKGSQTEFGYISEAVLRTALPQPGISFKLLHNGKVTLDLPATTEQERLLAAWPNEFRDQRLPIESRDAEVKLRGIIGLPELARPTQKYQHIYLNGRPIRDKFIQHALRESYRGLTEPGRYPAAILLLTVPPGDVDVNVHPTKSEVRFRDSGRIHGLVMAVVREKLMASDLAPVAIPMRTDVEDRERADMQARLAAFFKNPFSTPQQERTEDLGLKTELNTPVLQTDLSTQNSELRTHSVLNGNPEIGYSQPSVLGSQSSVLSSVAKSQSAIQLHNSYLVAQSDDGLVIIDQHALHERIMFEELMARVTRGPLESQRLLIPITLPASSRQMALLDQIQSLLLKLGIEVSNFGPETIAIQAFPSFLEKLDPADFVRELLERGEQELLDLHQEELLHEILDMMACKAAVKAGDPLTQAEIEALLARRELVERSSNCPHGRPTTLRMSLRDLEKQFKRTGF